MRGSWVTCKPCNGKGLREETRRPNAVVANSAANYEADDGPLTDSFIELLQQKTSQRFVGGRSLFDDAVAEENIRRKS